MALIKIFESCWIVYLIIFVPTDAAKRKQLPAWIREGLEKMEQERLKKIQKEKAEKEKAEKLAQAKLKSSLDDKNDDAMVMPAKSKFVSSYFFNIYFYRNR